MSASWLLATLLSACASPASEKPDASFDPVPAGAVRLDFDAPGAGPRTLLAGIRYANFERRNGQLFLFASASRWYVNQVCSDFGCIPIWATEPTSACWRIDGTTAAHSDGCLETSDRREATLPLQQQQTVDDALRVFSGSRQPTIRLGGAVLLSGSPDAGTYELLGDAQIETPAAEEFDTWVAPKVMRRSPIHYRLSVSDGGLQAPPLLQRSPDEVALLGGLMSFVDEGAQRLSWRNRDDTVFGLDTAARALAGTVLGSGAFGLGRELPFYPEGAHTGGVAVLGSQWLALLVAPSYESTADHGAALGGGPLQNLYLRLSPIEGQSALPLTHFTGLEATTPTPDSVVVCFNRQLAPESVRRASVTIEGLEVHGVELLPFGQCIAVSTAAQNPSTSYRVHVAGLESVDREAFDPAGQFLSFLPDQARFTDLLAAFFGVGPTYESNSATFVVMPLRGGSIVFRQGQRSPAIPEEETHYFVTGPDRRSRVSLTARYAAQGLRIKEHLLAPSGGTLWLTLQSGQGLIVLDGSQEHIYTAATHPGLRFDEPMALGDGSVVVVQFEGGLKRFTTDGAVEDYRGSDALFRSPWGIVLDSTDGLTLDGAGPTVHRFRSDGGRAASYDFTGVAGYSHGAGLVAADVEGRSLLCPRDGPLVRVEADGGLTRLTERCYAMSVSYDGSVWVRAAEPLSGDPNGQYRYSGGVLTPHRIPDPLYGLASAGWLERPFRLGNVVYAWATGGSSTPRYPATLRMMSIESFEALVPEPP